MNKIKKIRKRETEEIDLSTFNIDENIFSVKAKRQLSGKWTIQVRIWIKIDLGDNRGLKVVETVNLLARQTGRKKRVSEIAKKEPRSEGNSE